MQEILATSVSEFEPTGSVDLVGIGKASREMIAALDDYYAERVNRRFVVCDVASALRPPHDRDVRVGEHPVPGAGSRVAASELITFLQSANDADLTIFAVSGGASSLCNLVQEPLMPEDLSELWRSALRAGLDITTLNQMRAATSQIAGGLVLRHVRSPRSAALIMVDNVISGAPWVGSALTYDTRFSDDDVSHLIEQFQLHDQDLIARVREAARRRDETARDELVTQQHNRVVAEPRVMLDLAINDARARGYEVLSLGAHISGEASEVAREIVSYASQRTSSRPLCVIGAGEVTVSLTGQGSGGRCQELVWASARALSELPGRAALVARASDGQDHLVGVAGAWADHSTFDRIRGAGLDWSDVLARHDSNPALAAINQLIPGEHSGWNLCDLYVMCVSGAS
jgi:glycerate-2-kinase